jgi:hypothetical protein
MLSKNDLIFLGAAIIINGDVNRNGIQFVTKNGIDKAIELSSKLFKDIFKDDNSKDEMILG